MNDIDRDLFWLSFASNKGFGNKVKLGTTVNEHTAACLDEAKGTLKEVLAVPWQVPSNHSRYAH